jgi:hypothetical protein
MQKMSKLAQPAEKTSSEGAAAALLLAHVAWNRAVDPLGGDQVGYYRKVLSALVQENPKCLRELKSTDVRRHVGIESPVGNSQRKPLLPRGSLCQSADATGDGHDADGPDDDTGQRGHGSVPSSGMMQDHPHERHIPKADRDAQ